MRRDTLEVGPHQGRLLALGQVVGVAGELFELALLVRFLIVRCEVVDLLDGLGELVLGQKRLDDLNLTGEGDGLDGVDQDRTP